MTYQKTKTKNNFKTETKKKNKSETLILTFNVICK